MNKKTRVMVASVAALLLLSTAALAFPGSHGQEGHDEVMEHRNNGFNMMPFMHGEDFGEMHESMAEFHEDGHGGMHGHDNTGQMPCWQS